MKTNEIIEMGKELRELKKEISLGMRNGKYMGSQQWDLETKTKEFRHQHIAYSMALGREYKEIENYTRPGNEPNWKYIDTILFNEYGLFQRDGKTYKMEAQDA